MECRNLDITIISAEDLKKVNLIGKMHTYAVVWVDPYVRQHTSVDKDGGSNPSWNQKLSFLVPEHFFQQPNSHLTVEIFSKALISNDKFVGAAVVPLSELPQKTNQGETTTCEVKRRSGKVKGSLRLVTRVGEKTTISSADRNMPASMPVAAYGQNNQYTDREPYGYPPAGASMAPPYGYPPPSQYPQQAYGGYGGQGQQAYGGYGEQGQQAYGPSYGGQAGFYPQAGAPPQNYAAQPQRRQGMGGMGMGLGAGMLAGAVGGLVVGDMVGDAFDGGFDF